MTTEHKLNRIVRDISNKKIQTLNIFAVIGIIILLTYSGINFYLQDYPAAIFELVLSIATLFSIYVLNVLKRINLAIIIANIILMLVSIHNFYAGGFNSTGIFWVYVLVGIIFFINFKSALYWVSLLIMILLGIFIAKISGIITLPYDNFEVIMFFVSIITSSILTYLYILKIEEGYDNVEKTYADLQHALGSVNKKELELEKMLEDINTKTEELERFIGQYGKQKTEK